MNSQPPHTAYRPDIDGLRAIAVLAVLIFHAFPTVLPSGFIGVDVFFVISGFLISGIILDGLARGTFSFVGFYARRVRRIFPALTIVCAVSVVFGWFSLMPDEFRSLGKHVVGGAAFLSNLVLLKESGYFDVDARLKPLLHLWSLGIEEQYYLIWPALLYGCRGRRIVTAVSIATVGVGSFALNLHFTHSNASWAYYLPLTRFFELMIGSALAFALRNRQSDSAVSLVRPSNGSNLKSAIGAVVLIVCFIFIDERQPFPGWWALLVCAGVALLIDAGPCALLNQHFLASRPMVGIGLISYPLYLWHWPILAFGNLIARKPGAVFAGTALLASFVLAWLTYRFIELPLRQTRSIERAAWRLATAMVVLASIGALARLDVVLPMSAQDPRNVEIARARIDQVAFLTQRIAGTVKGTTLFFGDSHMQQYWPRIEFVASQYGSHRTVELLTEGGCAPIPRIERATQPGCLSFVTAGFERAARADVDIVVVASSWGGFIDRGDYYLPGVKGATHLDVLAPENQWIFDGFADALSELRKRGKRVVVLTSSPRGYAFDPGRMVDRSDIIPRYKVVAPVSLEALRASLSPIDTRIRAAADRAGAQIIDPDPWVCSSTQCPVLDPEGRPMYSDGTHIRASVARVRAVGLDQFVRMGAQGTSITALH
jgi:peptidoglycan/LPS O-acetylase OafA/YrhL